MSSSILTFNLLQHFNVRKKNYLNIFKRIPNQNNSQFNINPRFQVYFFTGEFLLTFNPTLTYYPKVILNIEIVLEKIEDLKI